MQLDRVGGVSQAFPRAFMWAPSRALREADGPDEVYRPEISSARGGATGGIAYLGPPWSRSNFDELEAVVK